MPRLLPAICILLFIAHSSPAQPLQFAWAKQVGAAQIDGAYSIVPDAAGNVYVLGEFNGTVDFDPGPGIFNMSSGGSFCMYILKLSPNGDFIWARQIVQLSPGFSIGGRMAIDPSGAIYYSCQLSGIVDADPGPGVYPLGSITAQAEAFVTKLDAAGNFQWAGLFTGNNAGIYGIKLDPSGNLLIAGFFQGTVDFDPGPGINTISSNGFTDIYIAKLSSSGAFVWVKGMGASDSWDNGYSISVDNAGNVYCTGSFSQTVDFDPGPGTFNLTTPVYNGFVLKLDNNGNFNWAKKLDASINNTAWSVAAHTDNTITIAGLYSGTADFDPGPGTSNATSAGGADIYVLKLDANGNFIWVKQMGGPGADGGTTIVADQQGNSYLTGYFNETVDFDPGPAVFNLVSGGGNDIYILKLDPAGNFVWVKQFVGSGLIDYGIGLSVDNVNNVYAGGMFENTTDFDPSPAVYNLTSNGQRDAYMVKLSRCTQTTTSILDVTECDSYTLNGQTYTATGTYTQTLVNSAGCDSIITLHLVIGKKATAVSASICEGQSYYAGGALQTSSGIYKDTLLTSLGCDSVITTTLTVHPAPRPNLGPDRNLCADGSTASISPGIFNSYLWQDNSALSSFSITAPGLYWVTVTDNNNCLATDSLRVLALDTIPRNFLPANKQVCFGSELKLDVPGYQNYLWSNGETTAAVSLRSFGIFYLTVTDFNNCTGTDSIRIIRANCIPIAIPNAFTPNADGRNDIFRPTINHTILAYHFVLYNRYGERIFETFDYGTGWDGTYKGKLQPAGSYVYRISFTSITGWQSDNNGSVLLIR